MELDEAASLLVRKTYGSHGRAVHLCNAYTLALAAGDRRLFDTLSSSSLNLPDGMPLVWIARKLGLPLTGRVYGPDLMLRTMELGLANGTRHYLYGSTPEVLQRLQRSLLERMPDLRIVGAHSPPFRPLTPDEHAALRETLCVVTPDVVWVGLGTPKQDFAVAQMASDTRATFVAIGAAFDFISGTKRQAPKWVQAAGMEWAFRLATEPRRLWRRYLIGNIRFAVGLLRHPPTRLPSERHRN